MNAPFPLPADPRLTILLDAVEILTATRFRIGGGPEIEAAQVPAMPPAAGVEPLPLLGEALATLLYAAAYARSYQGQPIGLDLLAPRPPGDPGFVATLAAANAGADRWEPGWQVYRADPGGALHVAKGDTALLVQPGSYAYAAGGGAAPGVGAQVECLFRRDSTALQPGYYHALGETPRSDHDDARIGRLYFHVAATDAAWLLGRLTATLNRYRLPFRLKTPTDPAHYDRTDALVLYVARRFLPATLAVLAPLAEPLAERLQAATPLFARPLLPGLAGADDPGTGESFGQSRCRMLAAAIVQASREPEARMALLAERFRRAGLDLARPHLAAGFTELYSLPGGAA